MLSITPHITIPLHEIDLSQIRSQGAGGQNVNKVATAVQLRFDINRSSLPEQLKKRLLEIHDSRLTKEGVIVIKSQCSRTYERNKEEGLQRLAALIRQATATRTPRKPTRLSKKKQQKRLDKKVRHGEKKELRKRVL